MKKIKNLLMTLLAITLSASTACLLTACEVLPDSLDSVLESIIPEQNPEDEPEKQDPEVDDEENVGGEEDGTPQAPETHVHNWGSWNMLVAPTCESAGSMQRVCTLDSAHVETETLSSLGHDLTDFEEKAATCTTIGWNAYQTCSRCDYSTYEKIFELGHSYGQDGLCSCGAFNLEEFFTFELSTDGTYYEIFEYTGEETAVNCPEYYKGLPVKVISNSAFVGRDLESVFIPKTITTIGDSAFQSCTCLTEVTIGSGVTTIGKSAFLKCTALTTVTIGDSVTRIGDSAFGQCAALETVIFGNNITTIGGGAFSNCKKLVNVNFPDSLISIGDSAFYSCGIKNIQLPDSLLSIGSRAFEFLGIESVTIPDSVSKVGSIAFGERDYSFYNEYQDGYYLGNEKNPYHVFIKPKTSRKSFTLHENTKVIADYAFTYDTSLAKINFSDSLITIGERAFYSCTNLTEIILPNTVTTIGDFAFENAGGSTLPLCNEYENGYYLGSADNPYHAFIRTIDAFRNQTCKIHPNTKIIADRALGAQYLQGIITIPDSVIAIGTEAFYYSTELTKIIIGANVEIFGTNIFQGCSSLTSVTFKNPNGWRANGTEIPAEDLSDGETAIENVNKYAYCIWRRSEE